MVSVIVAMPKIEDAKRISELLTSRGINITAICTSGSAILSKAHQLDSGIVVSSRVFKDMYCNEIVESLPDYFDMLLLTSQAGLEQCPSQVVTITMPFRASNLVSSVEMMCMQLERRIRKNRLKPKKRPKEEQDLIDKAKEVLMERNNMTEPEAFRYIQKSSMDSGTNMVETAQMILMLQVE
ncbi:MAG: ANTAR domain-containing response regulator [Lachnospiraceae bacterium]